MKEAKEVEMFVAGLVLDPATNAPIVILKTEDGEVCLPIWIGLAEATAIASALKKVELARPMTHDLLATVIEEFNAKVLKVYIRGLHENTFLADIEMVIGESLRVIDARPSDAIAVAVRLGAQIMVAEEVLKQAQVALVDAAGLDEEGAPPEGEAAEGEQGGTNFANIEKDKWAEILAEMDPDDFKYKM